MWCPLVISWFIAPETIVVSTINHGYCSYKPTERYRLGASHSRIFSMVRDIISKKLPSDIVYPYTFHGIINFQRSHHHPPRSPSSWSPRLLSAARLRCLRATAEALSPEAMPRPAWAPLRSPLFGHKMVELI